MSDFKPYLNGNAKRAQQDAYWDEVRDIARNVRPLQMLRSPNARKNLDGHVVHYLPDARARR